ncbi:MAG: DUF4158 domain-containing protein [bacterium]
MKFILQRYFPATDDFPNIEPTKPTRLSQQACILTLLHYQDCTKEIRGVLQEKAHYLATVFTKPIYIFKELINFLESHHIVLPAYSFMQYIVGKAIADERNRLELLVIRNMPEETKMALDKLLGAEDGVYELTLLKYEWNHYLKLSQKFKKNLRPIFLCLDFKSQTKKDPLIYAISFLKDVFHKNKRLSHFKPNAFQQEIISSKLSRNIYDKKRKGDKKITTRKEINGGKYEFLVYRLLKHRLESGEIFVSESLNFKSFEEDLIDNEKWKNKKQLIRSLEKNFALYYFLRN